MMHLTGGRDDFLERFLEGTFGNATTSGERVVRSNWSSTIWCGGSRLLICDEVKKDVSVDLEHCVEEKRGGERYGRKSICSCFDFFFFFSTVGGCSVIPYCFAMSFNTHEMESIPSSTSSSATPCCCRCCLDTSSHLATVASGTTGSVWHATFSLCTVGRSNISGISTRMVCVVPTQVSLPAGSSVWHPISVRSIGFGVGGGVGGRRKLSSVCTGKVMVRFGTTDT
uniref:Uncharacterized protein n=1 Tax=Anopheles farauti TaxID=69004 RepID=A0A182QE20_9DIPT